jgi:lipoic acid synthetase
MSEYLRKPEWLKIRLGNNEQFADTRRVLEKYHLNTICTSGKCPNQADCWSRGTATFMILGEVCTRSCRFCNTLTGKPLAPDPGEADRVADSVARLKLRHVVLTSVDRDDLPDLGVSHWENVVRAVKALEPSPTMETLIPDFQGRTDCLDRMATLGIEVISHNLETVRRLTPLVRSAARYDVSLSVLEHLSQHGVRTKSGLMLGLGETEDELLETMDDVLATGCSILTLGQYLQPSRAHLPVRAYIHPDDFARYREIGLQKGFAHVESGPLIRSSYGSEKQV